MGLSRSFIRNAPTTPLDARLMNMAGIASNGDGSPRVGVIGALTTPLLTPTGTTAPMTVNVAAAEFATSRGRADGVSIFANDGPVPVTITAAPISNSRIDAIWVKHNDNTQGDADSLPVFGVTAGTAAAVPVKPAVPTGATELGTIRVYSGTTAANGGSNTTTDTFAMTAARGAAVPFRTKADLDAWTARVGQLAVVLSNGSTYVRGTSDWIPTAHAAGILMRRSTTATTIPSAYTDLSANTFWTESNRSGGFAAYNNGVTVPYSGVYRINYSVSTTTIGVLAGITRNKGAGVALGDLECASSGGLAQGIAIAAASDEIVLAAGDVIRLYAIATSGSPAWRVEAGLSVFQVEFIRAA